MAPLFWKELLNFHAPKQPHHALEELKEKLALEGRNKALREFQDHSLQLLLCTILHLGIRFMEEFPSSHAGPLKTSRRCSILATSLLCTPLVHSLTSVHLAARSCSTLSASRSMRSVHHHHCSLIAGGLLETAVKQCIWEREMLLKTVPHGGGKPRNCFPPKHSRTQQLQAPPQQQHHHTSSNAAAT